MAETILIVDDNSATRNELAQLLTAAGYVTLTAGTVPSAMQVLADARPDLLITEVRVDTYNGLHLIAMAPRPVPAIVVTAYTDSVIEADARRLGAEYLSKPVSPTALRDVIERTLAGAAERGVFLPARRDARIPVTTALAVSVDDVPVRLLDISAGGARLEVPGTIGTGLPDAITLHFPAAQLTLCVDIAWKRRKDDQTWICGVAVPREWQSDWQKLFDLVPA